MDSSLLRLLLFHCQLIEDMNLYENPFETIRYLHECFPEEKKNVMVTTFTLWLEDLVEKEKMEFSLPVRMEKLQNSQYLRQKGNTLFMGNGEERNILGACRLYNDAIFEALHTKVEDLALAFANRAMALQTFGYYQQAYDDCVWALNLGYPENKRDKIVLRQAYCSIKMEDLDIAETHLNELQKCALNESFSKEFKNLLKSFNELKEKASNKDGNIKTDNEIDFSRENQRIAHTRNGRGLIANREINKNEIIFSERSSTFVTISDSVRMCHECGVQNFIPYPCLNCHGRVLYCSIKCQRKHIKVHKFECAGHKIQLFSHVGGGYLALKILIDNGFLTILDELNLNANSSTHEVWSKLTEGGEIWRNSSTPYASALRMITHFSSMTQLNIHMFSAVSYILVLYLKRFTRYFDILNARNNNVKWEVLIGSLILLHMGQSMYNDHVFISITPDPITVTINTDFNLLNENLWSSPWHIKLGYLHCFSNYKPAATLNLPYLSLCNHSCVPSMQIKFSARYISAYALRNFKKDEEITNCYTLGYLQSKRELRRAKLRENFNFDCQCENCIQTDSEDAYNKFCRYRCENPKCRKIFVPTTSEVPILDVVNYELRNKGLKFPCTICGRQQTFKWFQEGKYSKASHTTRMYSIFKKSDQYLLGFNQAKYMLASNCILQYFQLQTSNAQLSDQDYSDLIEMIQYHLDMTREQYSVNSIDYVIGMLYLWDLLAKRKYKCSKLHMDEMIWALEIVPDEFKRIFLNYYNDYIKDYI